MKIDTAFCTNCGCKHSYIVKHRMDSFVVRSIEFTYLEEVAYCPNCDKEVYVPEIHDYNCQAREIAYGLKTNNKTTK